jgi:hypothetical protein
MEREIYLMVDEKQVKSDLRFLAMGHSNFSIELATLKLQLDTLKQAVLVLHPEAEGILSEKIQEYALKHPDLLKGMSLWDRMSKRLKLEDNYKLTEAMRSLNPAFKKRIMRKSKREEEKHTD